jgi:hypothetical protein
MDEKVLDEGLTWKEMLPWLKGHPDPPSWIEILLQVTGKGAFPAAKRLKDGALVIDPLNASGRVLGHFLEKGSNQSILGTRKS